MNGDGTIVAPPAIDLTAIITTRNRESLLRDAIESVLAQQPSGLQVEVIVVDDGSTDATPEVASSYPAVRYIHTRQGSASGSRNVGIAAANGQWIAFLDDDDVWVAHKLQRFARLIHAQPDLRLVVSEALICDAALRPSGTWALHGRPGAPAELDVFDEQVMTPSAMICHREVFDQIGLFDTSVPRAEDREFFMRAAAHGYQARIIAEPLILYRTREKPDAGEMHRTYQTTAEVLRRHLTSRNGIDLVKRCRVTWKVRGWYAFHILSAAQHEASRTLLWKYRWLAFTISPLHWLRFHLLAR